MFAARQQFARTFRNRVQNTITQKASFGSAAAAAPEKNAAMIAYEERLASAQPFIPEGLTPEAEAEIMKYLNDPIKFEEEKVIEFLQEMGPEEVKRRGLSLEYFRKMRDFVPKVPEGGVLAEYPHEDPFVLTRDQCAALSEIPKYSRERIGFFGQTIQPGGFNFLPIVWAAVVFPHAVAGDFLGADWDIELVKSVFTPPASH